MARTRKQSLSTKNKRASNKASKAAQALQDLGIQIDETELLETIRPVVAADKLDSQKHIKKNYKEASVYFLYHPDEFIIRQCVECGEPFGTNYRAVACCSELCLVTNFEKVTRMPLEWVIDRLNKPLEERYQGFEPPLIVPPQVLKAFKMVSQNLADQEPEKPLEASNLDDWLEAL